MGGELVSRDPVTGPPAAVLLYWLPLGAGGHSVKWNGRLYELVKAAREGRRPLALYHAALEVRISSDIYVIEQTPQPDLNADSRGVVAEGPVGARWAGRFRIFRYEVRIWKGGSIPDLDEAIDSPRELSTNINLARRVLAVAPGVPPLVWGRDTLGTGEMWNSNAVISWILSRAGIEASRIEPPPGGWAPGWRTGIAAAHHGDMSLASEKGRGPRSCARTDPPTLTDTTIAPT